MTVNELTIYDLATDGGVFRIDASGEATGANHRNSTDYIMIKSGSGSAYVQPLDVDKLNGVSRANPVHFADAAPGVTFAALPETSNVEEGVLYDYQPVVEADAADDVSAFGRNWYFVDIETKKTHTTEVALASAAADYATAASAGSGARGWRCTIPTVPPIFRTVRGRSTVTVPRCTPAGPAQKGTTPILC